MIKYLLALVLQMSRMLLMSSKDFNRIDGCLLLKLHGEFFSFVLYDIQPAVLPLQVHLPYKQSVCFNTSENLALVMSSESRAKTVLTEFLNTMQHILLNIASQNLRSTMFGMCRVSLGTKGSGAR